MRLAWLTLPAHFAHKRARPRACRQEAAFNVMTGLIRRFSGQSSMAPGAGKCPEWQRELTVNQPPHGFEGSSPSFPTTLRPDGPGVAQPVRRSVSGVAGAQRKRRRTASCDQGCAWPVFAARPGWASSAAPGGKQRSGFLPAATRDHLELDATVERVARIVLAAADHVLGRSRAAGDYVPGKLWRFRLQTIPDRFRTK